LLLQGLFTKPDIQPRVGAAVVFVVQKTVAVVAYAIPLNLGQWLTAFRHGEFVKYFPNMHWVAHGDGHRFGCCIQNFFDDPVSCITIGTVVEIGVQAGVPFAPLTQITNLEVTDNIGVFLNYCIELFDVFQNAGFRNRGRLTPNMGWTQDDFQPLRANGIQSFLHIIKI